MGYCITSGGMDGILAALGKEYDVCAPKLTARRGKGNQQVVRYGKICSTAEMVLDKPSDFSPKEVFYPILQTLFYIKENEYSQSRCDDRGTVIFARPCDINGIRRMDKIFLSNGGHADLFYQRRRDKLKIFMLECLEGWDECFCVSMGANVTEDYSVALRFTEKGTLADVKDAAFEKYFAGCAAADFSPEYVKKNSKTVAIPPVDDSNRLAVNGLEMWKQYDEKCVSCGGCNAVCITCSCFDTTDVIYDETSRSGERRRVWASCMQESYTAVAGGHKVRNSPAQRMRFKTMHKIYDFKKRFGEENMCVGCGRCQRHCPADIAFSDTINTLAAALKRDGD